MLVIGLDMGTTTLSAVVLETDGGQVLESLTVPNNTDIKALPWERLQNPDAIWNKASGMLDRLTRDHPGIACIGLTGQMHGLLYADAAGNAVSPLYTWQDKRGEQLMPSGNTYVQTLSETTASHLATGYGAATHFYNVENGCVPANAESAMTIHDYIGMKLTRSARPLTHVSDTASFGAPNWPELQLLVHTTDKTMCMGQTVQGIPVSIAIGDNQASFIGSVKNARESVLVNVGTGGQISVAVDGPIVCEGAETRPYVDGGSLLVGFSLCGGYAYSLLERLFREIASLGGANIDSMYELMNALADAPVTNPLQISTLFRGTRQNPSLRGSITQISDENLTAAHLVQGVLSGMAAELHEPYAQMIRYMNSVPTQLVGAGNAIRQNAALRRIFEETFGMQIVLPMHCEEAAYGAALFSLAAAGFCPTVADAQQIIRFK
ncbi:hypothetical protein FACS18948_1430 [Clostridia bacterium]|nr:hypothetical protein FACS18948_1430 [Clostridia bacterium]